MPRAAPRRPPDAEFGDRENHDCALEDLDDLDRHVAEQLDRGASRRQRAEQNCSKRDADRGIAASTAIATPVKP